MTKKDKEIFEKYRCWGVVGLHRKELYEKCFKCTKDGKEITIDELDNYIYDIVKKESEKANNEKKEKEKISNN